jgi:ABC-type phosphate/phosphonate transport system substrate-binding protein
MPIKLPLASDEHSGGRKPSDFGRPHLRRVTVHHRFLITLAATLILSAADGQAQSKPVRIGLIETIFGETSKETIEAQTEEFKKIMEERTGRKGESKRVTDFRALADDLAQGKLDMAVCHGFELAWIKKEYPQLELRPLVVAVNEDYYVKALIIVGAKDAAKTVADLKGKTLALSKQTKAYSKLFLERRCEPQSVTEFFPTIARDYTPRGERTKKPLNSEAALNLVATGKAQATVVDAVAWNEYKKRNSIEGLRILEESAEFPATAVVYNPKSVDTETQDSYRKALSEFHTGSKAAKDLLQSWRLTQFKPVPPDYDSRLQAIGATFPPPKP